MGALYLLGDLNVPHYIPAGDHVSRGKPRGAGRTIDAPERLVVIDERPGPWRRPLPLLWGCTAEQAARIRGER